MLKTIIVQGHTQSGKSTLLNVLINKGSQSFGANQRVQFVWCINRSKVFVSPLILLFVEVPEFRDIQRDTKTVKSVKLTLASTTELVDALFVVQSLAEFGIDLEGQFSRAKAMYGSVVLKSIIVVITKSDITPPEDVDWKIREIDMLCRAYSIPWVMWTNNSEAGNMRIDQVDALRTALGVIRPFEIGGNTAEPRTASHGYPKEVWGLPQQVEFSFNPMYQPHPIQSIPASEMQDQYTVEESKQESVETTAELNTTVPYSPPQIDTVQQAGKRPIQRGGIDCPYKLRKLQDGNVVKRAGEKEDGSGREAHSVYGRAPS